MSNWSVFTKFFTIILAAVRMFLNGVGAGTSAWNEGYPNVP